MAESTDIRVVTFACLCRHVTGSFKIPERDLPLSLTLCHCYTCRHQSGLMCITGSSLPPGTEFEAKGPLELYKASEDLSRFFCGNCGANIYMEDKEAKKEISGGVLEGAGEDVVRLDQHIFVTDTKDGGLRDWLPEVNAWDTYQDVSKKLDAGWQDESVLNASSSSGQAQELHAYCRCKGVSFKITRPDEGSAGISAPRGEIVGQQPPPTTTTKEDKIDSAWWLRDNGTKYLGGICACSDCRLASGYDIQTWAFVSKANILQLDGTPLDFSAGTLKRYNSSKGVYREFCGKCGATVFYRSDSRPDLIDVSVGLLDAEEGTRAESWLGWKTNRVSYEEEAQNKSLIKKLGAGLKHWGEAEGN